MWYVSLCVSFSRETNRGSDISTDFFASEFCFSNMCRQERKTDLAICMRRGRAQYEGGPVILRPVLDGGIAASKFRSPSETKRRRRGRAGSKLGCM